MTGCEPSADAAKAPYSCLSDGPPRPLRPPGRAGRAPGRLQRLRADAKPGRGGIRFQDGAGAGGLPVTPLGVVVRPRRLCACGLASTSPPPSPAIPVTWAYRREERGKPGVRPAPGCFTLIRSHQMHALIPSRAPSPLLDAWRLLPGRRKPSPLPVGPRPSATYSGRGLAVPLGTAAPPPSRAAAPPPLLNSVWLWGQKAPGGRDGWGGPDNWRRQVERVWRCQAKVERSLLLDGSKDGG